MKARSGLSRVIAGFGLALLAASCGHEYPKPVLYPTDPAGRFFDPDHIVDVALEMDAHDYEVMRHQTRTWSDVVNAPNGACMTEPVRSVFTDFHGTATIDGQRLQDVGLRKKGFMGSLDSEKPSLRVKLDQYVPGQTLAGQDRLVLNASLKDPSYVKQCLAYGMFAKAGVPAPRCNFAHVTMNGQDLGLYVHVEGTDKRFLRRHFEDENGDLWKSTLADFRPLWLNMFELLTNEPPDDDQARADRRRLVELTNVLQQSPDASMYSKLEKIVDIDEFLSFWAMEVLLEKRDGYANNANNTLVYDDPLTRKFVFIPWDTDGVLKPDPFQTPLPPPSVLANGVLAHRLYLYPTTRDRYLARLRDVIDSTLHEDEMVAEVDRMQGLILPLLERQPQGAEAALEEIEQVRQYIRTRRAVLLADLAQGPRPWTYPLLKEPCRDLAGSAEGTFVTLFGAKWLDALAFGTGTLRMTYRGRDITIPLLGSTASWQQIDRNQIWPVINMHGRGSDDVWYNVWIYVRPELFRDAAELSFDRGDVWGSISLRDSYLEQYMGSFFTGSVSLKRAAATDGAPIEGSFNGSLIRWN